jgi:hypothetical protein
MKTNLKELVKTRSPLKDKIKGIIGKNVQSKSLFDVVPTSTIVPTTNIEENAKEKTRIGEPDKTNYIKAEAKPETRYADSLREIVKSLITNNYNIKNYYNNNTQEDIRKFNSTLKNITGNDVRKSFNTISSLTNRNIVKNLTENKENNSYLKHDSPTNNIETKRNSNYITSSINIPFTNPKTSSHKETKVFTNSKEIERNKQKQNNNNQNEIHRETEINLNDITSPINIPFINPESSLHKETKVFTNSKEIEHNNQKENNNSQTTNNQKENNNSQTTNNQKENNNSQTTNNQKENNNNQNEIHRETEINLNDITSPINIPFINPESSLHIINPESSLHKETKVFTNSKEIEQNNQKQNNNSQTTNNQKESKTSTVKEKPMLIQKMERFYNPVQNIKLKTPSIAKFPDVIDSSTTSFSKENKNYTNKIQNILESYPSVRLFTTKGDVIKSTKEVINHIRTRQNNIIPMLQSGGIIDQPTLAMLGEAGPEMVSPTSGLENLIPQSETSNSIASMANTTLQERAGYQMQQNANQMKKPETSEPIKFDSSAFQRNPEPKQTPPAGGAAGGEAGSSSFDSYLRARMFSLPDWRSRLG